MFWYCVLSYMYLVIHGRPRVLKRGSWPSKSLPISHLYNSLQLHRAVVCIFPLHLFLPLISLRHSLYPASRASYHLAVLLPTPTIRRSLPTKAFHYNPLSLRPRLQQNGRPKLWRPRSDLQECQVSSSSVFDCHYWDDGELHLNDGLQQPDTPHRSCRHPINCKYPSKGSAGSF